MRASQARAPAGGMTEDGLTAEYVALLARAGIAMPPGRLAEAVAEFAELRAHVERVNDACPPEAEPATLFSPWR